jgi:hypothetical protein
MRLPNLSSSQNKAGESIGSGSGDLSVKTIPDFLITPIR